MLDFINFTVYELDKLNNLYIKMFKDLNRRTIENEH